MKHRLILFLAVVVLIFISTIAISQEDESFMSKLSGRVEIGVMGITGNSKVTAFDAEEYEGVSSDFSTIYDYETQKPDETIIATLLLFDMNYMLKDDFKLYFGTPFFDDNRGGLTLGFEKLFQDNSILDFSIYMSRDTLWKDPYLIGIQREITYSDKIGLTADYDGFWGTDLNASYTLEAEIIEDDLSGNNNPALQRSGLSHSFKTGYNFFLNQNYNTIFTPSVFYTRTDKSGDAYSNNALGAAFNYSMEKLKNAFTVSGAIEISQYDSVHPLFNKERKDMTYSLECYYMRKKLWNRNWYFRVGGGYSSVTSNINFFDETAIAYGVTFGREFE